MKYCFRLVILVVLSIGLFAGCSSDSSSNASVKNLANKEKYDECIQSTDEILKEADGKTQSKKIEVMQNAGKKASTCIPKAIEEMYNSNTSEELKNKKYYNVDVVKYIAKKTKEYDKNTREFMTTIMNPVMVMGAYSDKIKPNINKNACIPVLNTMLLSFLAAAVDDNGEYKEVIDIANNKNTQDTLKDASINICEGEDFDTIIGFDAYVAFGNKVANNFHSGIFGK